jgi:hypothetical protein
MKKLVFDDDEGLQAYSEDIPPDRELVTTPYDPPVKTLVSEIKQKDLIVNPPFQRKSIWDATRKSRLIESLLLNIPIPVCFFAEDKDGSKVVVDGQQRLRAIEEFLSGSYALTGLQVLDKLNTMRWTDLTPRQTRIIENRTIRCIVISDRSDENIRFEVFERLNTGGVPLNDQELRNCVYRGGFNDLLDELTRDRVWLFLLGQKAPDKRLRHHELILRYFAINKGINSYKPPLKGFLNDYMKSTRNPSEDALALMKADFMAAVSAVHAVFGDRAFRRVKVIEGESLWDSALNRAVFDIQMLGLQGLSVSDLNAVAPLILASFETLCRNDAAFSESITKSTADRRKFYLRLLMFRDILRKAGLVSPILENIPVSI